MTFAQIMTTALKTVFQYVLTVELSLHIEIQKNVLSAIVYSRGGFNTPMLCVEKVVLNPLAIPWVKRHTSLLCGEVVDWQP